jgi:hypothetical protein
VVARPVVHDEVQPPCLTFGRHAEFAVRRDAPPLLILASAAADALHGGMNMDSFAQEARRYFAGAECLRVAHKLHNVGDEFTREIRRRHSAFFWLDR